MVKARVVLEGNSPLPESKAEEVLDVVYMSWLFFGVIKTTEILNQATIEVTV